MKLALVGNPTLYGIKRLFEEALKLGIEAEILDYSTFFAFADGEKVEIECGGNSLFDYDAVLYRFGGDRIPYLKYLHDHGVFVYDCPLEAKFPAKMPQYIALSTNGIKVPKTYFLGKSNDIHAKSNILSSFGYPVILKQDDGNKGRGVYLCKDIEEIIRIMEADSDKSYLLQEFIGEKADLRVIVLGSKAIGSMLKKASGDDFRTNFSQGGSVENYELTSEIANLAVSAAKHTNTYFAGIDIMFHNEIPYVLEVNAVPQFEGFEKVTDINVAGYLIEDLVKQYDERQYKL